MGRREDEQRREKTEFCFWHLFSFGIFSLCEIKELQSVRVAEKKKRDFEKIIRRRLSVVKMGVHTQGESGFFDDDPDELPAMVQNESIEQHETANATVGKCHMFPTHTHTTHKSTWPKKKKRKL